MLYTGCTFSFNFAGFSFHNVEIRSVEIHVNKIIYMSSLI